MVPGSRILHLLSISSAGLFAGLSLEGTALIERKDANKEFYGSAVPARDILGGRVPPPEVASRLYEIIEAAEVSASFCSLFHSFCMNSVCTPRLGEDVAMDIYQWEMLCYDSIEVSLCREYRSICYGRC